MNTNLIKKCLPEVFADELEQSIFLYLVDNYQVSPSGLARFFEISRTKINKLLASWSDLGLIKIQKSPTQNLVQLANIDILQDLIAKKQQKLHQIQSQIQNAQIQKNQSITCKHQQIQLFDQILLQNSTKADVRHFGDMDKIVLMLGIDWANEYIDKRIRMGIRSKDIVSPSNYLKMNNKLTSKAEIREVKFTSSVDIESGFILANNTIFELDYRRQAILIFENSPQLQVLQAMFDSNWSSLQLV
jgi:sugar-specific transcriptional regulator TrmB